MQDSMPRLAASCPGLFQLHRVSSFPTAEEKERRLRVIVAILQLKIF